MFCCIYDYLFTLRVNQICEIYGQKILEPADKNAAAVGYFRSAHESIIMFQKLTMSFMKMLDIPALSHGHTLWNTLLQEAGWAPYFSLMAPNSSSIFIFVSPRYAAMFLFLKVIVFVHPL